ncbi:ATP-dependent DNA helicase [Kangiella sediminilitoris]|uniref:DNA 5'-3' helicase n=1 Tax=Kangiella sediminilitoris TaxID=1144748 RepID=A0A1B3BB71_9GAMM|nr:ATP-dependent DNA helicase [Kangiella sediminilitoris]AOE50024.1 Helicase c2 [Kangiella sediminilitoris]
MAESFTLKSLFSSDGALSKIFTGFKQREEQLAMADAIEEVLVSEESICIEAGTGTGKTFGYLVPALKSWHLNDKKVLLSTGTKNLQDQLYYRDLPNMRKALGVSPKISLLKGRNNYLCLYRMKQSLDSGQFQSRAMADSLVKVKDWSRQTQSGDLTQCADLSDDDPLWPYVTSTNDNCLGVECPDFADCYVAKARQKATAADVVVVNHHLLLADMVLKDDGFGELLPDADIVVVDEAHQLTDIAHSFYGQRLTSRQLMEICRDTELEALTTAKDDRQLSVAVRRVEGAVNEVRLLLGESGKKANWQQISSPDLEKRLKDLEEELLALCERLERHASRSKGLDSCHRRCEESLQSLAIFNSTFSQSEKKTAYDAVRWVETYRNGFAILETPLNVSESFSRSRREHSASSWIFTSATMTQADDFTLFKQELGLQDSKDLILPSPFDYGNQAILHIPRGLPDPRDRTYIDSWQKQLFPLVEHNPGGTFVLFTSYAALNKVKELWKDKLQDKNLFAQGDLPKNELIERFRDSGDAVLLATSSFWEGVDVKGEALSLVIIDKLPFAAPDEPLIEAKIQAARKSGKNPFFDIQIPQAIIALKQGAGRLIRDYEDKGVLVLCDPRLIANGYGKRFLKSLPPMKRTRNKAVVLEFLKNLSFKSIKEES